MITKQALTLLADPPLLPPNVRAQIAEMRGRIHSTLGQVVLAMAALPPIVDCRLKDVWQNPAFA
jgi:hypothetical protein